MGCRTTILPDFVLHEFWLPMDLCCVCGLEVIMDFGLPCYEGDIVPNDWTGEWGGFCACQQCYEAFRDIKEPLSLVEAKKMIESRRAA